MIKRIGLNGNQLKIIAMLAMLTDHLGCILLPQYGFLRVIGRLAFPIFAYMIAEGCLYTGNRCRYFMTIFALGFACQTAYFAVSGSMYMNILITFSLSVLTVYAADSFLKSRTLKNGIYLAVVLAAVAMVTLVLPVAVGDDFGVDYGFFGVMLPVGVYFAKTREAKLFVSAVLLAVLSWVLGGNQAYSLYALLLLMLYNGERGRWNLKYLFYIFYPTHLAVLQLLKMLI